MPIPTQSPALEMDAAASFRSDPWMPPCTMGKSACSGYSPVSPSLVNSSCARSSQRSERSLASRASAIGDWPGTTWSNCMTTSAPMLRSICITDSGVKVRAAPFRCERNSTPFSLILRRPSSENTWKPPESVRMGRSQAMNLWMPPSSRIRVSVGRSCRWYALARIIVAPARVSSSGSSALTVPACPPA